MKNLPQTQVTIEQATRDLQSEFYEAREKLRYYQSAWGESWREEKAEREICEKHFRELAREMERLKIHIEP